MRTVQLLAMLALGACSKSHEPPPANTQPATQPATKTAVPRDIGNAADALLEREPCTAPAKSPAWAGRYQGSRPMDPNNPYAHRGPTRVTLAERDGKLHYIEGVGAAATDVDLVSDANTAHGTAAGTKDVNAFSLDTKETTTISITKSAVIAACLDENGNLHLARVLDSSGTGIQTQHEADVVVLERMPPPPPAPPPPAGFKVLAEGQNPTEIVLSPTEVIWAAADDSVPVKHAIRAVPRAGGEIREIAAGLQNVLALAVHGEHLYFAEAGANRIARVPLAGGAVETVVEDVRASKLLIAGEQLVWLDFEDIVRARPIADKVPHRLFSLPKRSDDVTFTVTHIATDGRQVYIAYGPLTSGSGGTIVRVPIGGGAPTTVARATVCGGLAASAEGVAYTTCDAQLFVNSRLVGRDLSNPDSVAFAKSSLVVIYGAGAGEIVAFPMAGGKPRTVIGGEFWPEQLAIDADGKTAFVADRGVNHDRSVPQGRIGKVSW